MNIIEDINKQTMEEQNKNLPEFAAGDTLRVHVKVKEGTRERIQVFEGVCIARSNNGVNSAFTVRKLSFGEGVERVFPLYSPIVDQIEVTRRGDVRRAKLYYLRGRTGKAARITEKKDFSGKTTTITPKAAAEKKTEAAAEATPPAEAAKTAEAANA